MKLNSGRGDGSRPYPDPNGRGRGFSSRGGDRGSSRGLELLTLTFIDFVLIINVLYHKFDFSIMNRLTVQELENLLFLSKLDPIPGSVKLVVSL